jgi:hypothetical protein
VNKCGNVVALRSVREWNCDKKTEQSAGIIMEGQKEENTVFAMVSDPALTLFGFIKFLKQCFMKLIFAT